MIPGNLTTLLGGGVIIGAIAASWKHIRGLAGRIRALLIVRAETRGSLAHAVGAWCWANCRRSRWGDRRYIAWWVYPRQSDQSSLIPFEEVSKQTMILWRGFRPLWVQHTVAKTDEGGEATLTLSFVRGLFNLDRLLADACENFTQRRRGTERRRFHIHRLFGAGPPEARAKSGESPQPVETAENGNGAARLEAGVRPIGHAIDDLMWDATTGGDADPLDGLAYPREVWSLIHEADRWLACKDWFRQRGLPWRRGWQLHGVPGTGKTSLARAVAWRLDMPVFCFDMSSMNNEEFVRYWRRASSAAPCIVLIEDIDAVFDGRRNLLGRNGGGLTFDCLLNAISGIQAAEGVFLIVTTNNGHDLDPALTRAGRIDRAVEFKAMDEDCRRKTAQRILSDCRGLIAETVRAGDGDTAAAFTDRCAQAALKRFWEGATP